jgi:hypothetical protein
MRGIKLWIVGFQMRDYGVQIFEIHFILKMSDLLVTKYHKRDFSIVNNFFRSFIINCYSIVLSYG